MRKRSLNAPSRGQKLPKVWLFGEITDYVAERVCREIVAWDDPTAPVIVMLNSPGGLVSSAFAIYDALMLRASTVIATGLCGSAANIVLQAGDKRLATPSTEFYLHNAQSPYWEAGAYADARIYSVMVSALGEVQYREAVRKRTFGTEDALRLGVIDGEDKSFGRE